MNAHFQLKLYLPFNISHVYTILFKTYSNSFSYYINERYEF